MRHLSHHQTSYNANQVYVSPTAIHLSKNSAKT